MEILLAELRASFLRHLTAEGHAEHTRKTYGTAVRLFERWLADHGHPPTTAGFTRALVTGWLAELSATRSPATVATRHRGLRMFGKWAAAEGEIDGNPLDGLREPPVQPPPVPVLDDGQIAALLKQCEGRDFFARRDEAMVRLFVDCGLRVGELVGLNVTDVDLDRQTLVLHRKGGKIGAAYPGARTTRALDRYLRVRRGQPRAEDPALFIGKHGRLIAKTVRDRVKRLGERAGIPGLHPHVFRHTWANDWLEAGGDRGDLKSLAGWSSEVMLYRYGASQADARAQKAARRLRRGDRF